MIASLGVVIVVENVVALVYGNEVKTISNQLEPSVAFAWLRFTRIQVLQFLVGIGTFAAVGAAVPGVCFASYITYIDPTSFTLTESIFIACILLVGGSGNLKGPMAGVAFMIILPELLRFVGLPDTVAANLREILYGVLLIVLMYMKPRGLAGAYAVK